MANNTVKTTKVITEALAIALLGLSVLAGCGPQQTQETQGLGESVVLEDTGPNSQLGNNELLTAAYSSMNALHSFHVEFTEQPQDLHWDNAARGYVANTTTESSNIITITADIQDESKGNHFKLLYKDDERLGLDQEALMIGMLGREKHTTDLLVAKNELYESRDGGTTWIHHGPGSAGFALLPVLQYALPIANPFRSMMGGGDQNYIEYMSKDLVFEDGSPRLEKIDGTTTRHIVADLKKLTPGSDEDSNPITNPWFVRVESISLWISTDADPKLMQMSVVVRSKVDKLPGMDTGWPDQVHFAFNWRWSKFNEDPGIIEAPSGKALIPPVP